MKKNLRLFERPYPRVEIHQDSIKHTRKGHPWIIADSYTQKFPRHNLFLIGVHPKTQEEIILFINDWRHPKIKGRVWAHQEPFVEKIKDFQVELGARLESALAKRLDKEIPSERDNFYWTFGEADLVPGLFIQFLGEVCLIQTFSSYWFPLEFVIVNHVERLLKNYFPNKCFSILIQERFPDCRSEMKKISNKEKLNHEMIISEFGIQYEIRLFEGQDPGIYTDAASVRKKLLPYYQDAKTILNLYSYTGAFSLQGLKYNKQVTSVDLSAKYMNWLEKNIELNQFQGEHQSLVMSTEKALRKLKKQEKSFDMIICDPPSSSSNGNKITPAIKEYDHLIPLIIELLSKEGHGILFLNTHSISKKKFQEKVLLLIKDKARIVKEFKLGEDCPTLKGFPEGNYLKTLIIQKI